MSLFDKPLDTLAGSVALQPLLWPELRKRGIHAYIRRDDQLPVAYSGNKFYKLYYNLRNARQQGCSALVSFGGYYSNHLHALAAAGQQVGLPTVGIIRGHEPSSLSPTLVDARSWGMRLFFVSKADYRHKTIGAILPILKAEFGNFLLLPEGGENFAGIRGCMAIARSVGEAMAGRDYTLCTAAGSGATLAGLILGSPANAACLGCSVLKGDDRLTQRIKRWLTTGRSHDQASTWQVLQGYHQGGYARVTRPLLSFMMEFEQRNQLLLEPVYTAKLLWAIEQLAKQGYWRSGSHVIALHTGGLQGRRGFNLAEAGQ